MSASWAQGEVTHHAFHAARHAAAPAGADPLGAEFAQDGLMHARPVLGGNGRQMRQRATGDAKGMRERQRVGIAGAGECAQRGFVHQGADGEMREQQNPRFLADQLRRFAAEHALRALQNRVKLS